MAYIVHGQEKIILVNKRKEYLTKSNITPHIPLYLKTVNR